MRSSLILAIAVLLTGCNNDAPDGTDDAAMTFRGTIPAIDIALAV